MSNPPILLLKTQSLPTDPYETLLSTAYAPHFLPVLTHTLLTSALSHLQSLFSSPETLLPVYDGIILTSQRAVEALDSALESAEPVLYIWAHIAAPSKPFPIFVVGPATYTSVSALVEKYFPSGFFVVLGQESGTGEALVEYVLNYKGFAGEKKVRRVLFPTGEKRRDTVPRVLSKEEWVVDEVPCYETVTRREFGLEFGEALKRYTDVDVVWVVVFSPQGCAEMLGACGWVDGEGKVVEKYQIPQGRRHGYGNGIKTWIKVMSIGPTTRQYLMDEFGFQVDAVAVTPSAGGILQILESDRCPTSIVSET